MAYALAMTDSERIVLRIRDEMNARKISQRELADLLTRKTGEVWTQSAVGKVLTHYVKLQVEDLSAICRCIGLTMTEAVRDPTLEFYAEMRPSELTLFHRLRRRPDLVNLILATLRLPPLPTELEMLESAPKPKRGRPLMGKKATANEVSKTAQTRRPGKR